MKSTQYFKKNKKGFECLNCGQPLSFGDNFCSNCGQVNDELPLSIKQFISEFFAGFFSFDTRFFNTILPLLFKPGKVSKEYIEGKRRKYTNPFKLYLHTSILFFLIMGINSTINNFRKLNTKEYRSSHNPELLDSITKNLEKDSIHVDGLDFTHVFKKKLDSIFKHTNYKTLLNSETTTQKTKDSLYANLLDLGMQTDFFNIKLTTEGMENLGLQLNTKTHKLVVKEQIDSYFRKNKIEYKTKESSAVNINFGDSKRGKKLDDFINFQKDNKDFTAAEALDSLGYKPTRMNLFLYQKAGDLNKLMTDKDFQRMYIKSFVSKISIALFFLLPILALLYSLLYIRHRYGYTEHLVVVFNIQTVFFILLIIGILLDALLSSDFFTPILQFTFIFYVYKTLRNFYKQGRFKSFVKFLIINFGYFLIAMVGVIIISFISFLL